MSTHTSSNPNIGGYPENVNIGPGAASHSPQYCSNCSLRAALPSLREKTMVPKYGALAILQAVAELYHLRTGEIYRRDNSPYYSKPRAVAMFLLRQCLGLSTPTIGRLCGGFHHSTVIYQIRQVKKLGKQNAEFRSAVQTLLTKYSERTEITAA